MWLPSSETAAGGTCSQGLHTHTHTHTHKHDSAFHKHIKWQGLTVSQSSINLYRLRVAHMIKNLPAPWQTQVHILGQEYLLEEGMAAHSSILAWRSTWTEEPGAAVHRDTRSQT